MGLARQRPGVAAWCLLFVLVLPQLRVWEGLPEPPEYLPTEHEAWLQDRAEDAVAQVLRVVGGGVRIAEIQAQPLDSYVRANYWNGRGRIQVSSNLGFSRDQMLYSSAHECVHAMFDQAGLRGYWPSGKRNLSVLVEETTAYVLGAHIAGMARTREGGDGRALTQKLFSEHRDACDTSSPTSQYRWLWDQQAQHGQHAVSPKEELSISIHFGSTEMVDEIDKICRENPDPLQAARAVVRKYSMVEDPERVAAAIRSSWVPQRGR